MHICFITISIHETNHTYNLIFKIHSNLLTEELLNILFKQTRAKPDAAPQT